MTMKVKLRARRLCNVIDKGTDKEDDMLALEAILAAVPAEYMEPLGAKNSAKETWEAIAAMRVGFDRAKKAMAQLLKQEDANLKFKDSESVENFSLCLQSLISKLRSHGITIDEEEIALSIETMLDLSTLTIEDVTAHLRATDERMELATATADIGKLLLTEEEWVARMKEKNSREAYSSHGGNGKHRGKASSKKRKKKKKVDPIVCRRYGKMGHWAKECPNHK
ncbi:uncharacterized protein [Miscanthus floridulus]|uniref:uncharacterized protein n=1 Tax=Miscanthus floridulus TaxID=154761 RepID=UPI003458DF72